MVTSADSSDTSRTVEKARSSIFTKTKSLVTRPFTQWSIRHCVHIGARTKHACATAHISLSTTAIYACITHQQTHTGLHIWQKANNISAYIYIYIYIYTYTHMCKYIYTCVCV